MKKVIVDIWGGEMSLVHVARFVQPVDVSLKIAVKELEAGYLVNLRADEEAEKFKEFETRSAVVKH